MTETELKKHRRRLSYLNLYWNNGGGGGAIFGERPILRAPNTEDGAQY